MKVVIVNKFLSHTGGADRHCVGLGHALVRRGHEVAYLAARHDLGEGDVVERAVRYVDPTVTHASRDALPAWGRMRVAANAFWNRSTASAMERLIDSFGPEVVHVHKLHPQLSPAPAVIAARMGVPVVQTLHDFELIAASPTDSRGGRWDRDETRFSYRLLNSAARPYRRRTLVGSVSEFVSISRFVARVYDRHGIRSTVIPSFVDAVDAHEAPLSFDHRAGVLFVGRLQPEKGVSDVIHLAKTLPDIQFTIAGMGDLWPAVSHAAQTLDNLTATGFVKHEPRLNEMVRRARLVVIPSRCQEGANLVCLESLARGTPVVAYANGGLAENVGDSGGGRIVPVDTESLARVVREVYGDRDGWQEMSERGHLAFQERHTPDVYVIQLEKVYERAAGVGR
jgi:glycosyltransferase involved in cell wall biosynthesis